MKKITKLLLALMFITSMHETHAQVCTFPGAECCGEGITNFQLNGTPAINRTSTVNENGGFTNTGLTTTVVSGQTYNFSVTFPLENNIVNCNTYNFKIYIDYNQNNLLTDAGEEAVSLANVETGTQTGSFTIPTTALIGNAYMRVMMKMAFASLSGGSCGHSAVTPCNIPADPIGFHGEVENYTLNITSTVGMVNHAEAPLFSVYPNPASANLLVYFYLPEPSDVSVNIYNILGEKIHVVPSAAKGKGNNSFTINFAETNISGAGVYFLEMQAGNKRTVQRFIVL